MNTNWKTTGRRYEGHQNGDWVKVIANIRRNSDGVVRRYETKEILWDGEDNPNTFQWAENNYLCDCNRRLFFLRAEGEDEEEAWAAECSHGEFSVNLENPTTGEIYYREFE